jgi:hypothetical protein
MGQGSIDLGVERAMSHALSLDRLYPNALHLREQFRGQPSNRAINTEVGCFLSLPEGPHVE